MNFKCYEYQDSCPWRRFISAEARDTTQISIEATLRLGMCNFMMYSTPKNGGKFLALLIL